MKRILKITGFAILMVVFVIIGFAIYKYQTDEVLKAMINHDESKLAYSPSKDTIGADGYDYKEYQLQVNDSITTYNYFFKTKKKCKGYVFFIHGSGGNAIYLSNLYKTLIDAGFSVYAADWRGYGKADGSPNYRGVLRDTEVAFDDFLTRIKSDSLKTIVYGVSLGGQLAIKITKDNLNDVDALVLDGAFESAQQIAIDYAPFDFLKNRAKNHPEDFNQIYIGVRDIKEIRNTPKLIIHSLNDLNVSINHGNNLFNNALEPKEFWRTNTSHIMTLRDLPDETIERIERLIQ
ncbi:lysophospholipase [Cellulophaga baltica]|uniref:alpha/beta hydrolase n=1 Tax=Cellulophaga TaxID=104264 RepID=UPI001C07E42A|nr:MULTISPECIES: alpha/beta fold hydrolase [Cellulophaga]MBU2996178.1 lysophospholipase [Cellulophaga baltica]MDO6767573.1 alpha/beta fold hydrolase [Cellulophaga sp. 1_MG-2023]